VQITAEAQTSLKSHEAKLALLVGSLPGKGGAVYRALQATMSMALTQDNIAHFESALRKRLEDSIGSSIELQRTASGQWRCSYSGEEFVVSIRTEFSALLTPRPSNSSQS
jgi:hypothetical protein